MPNSDLSKVGLQCYKCLGSGKHHRKDKLCRVCGGSGKVTNTFVEESKKMIQAILEAEMSSKIEETIRQSFINQSQMMQSQPKISNECHEGIKCSNCGVNPIVGPRYMCPQRKDYNLCYLCEEVVESEHALLKVKAKKQADDYLSFSLSQSQLREEVKKVPLVLSGKQLESERVTPKLKPGQKVSEYVMLQNDGTLPWPATAILKVAGGVNFFVN